MGRKIHGARSWIALGPLSFEPVEFAKLGFILVLVGSLVRSEREMSSIRLLIWCFRTGGASHAFDPLEPYLGGTLVYVPIVLGMLYFRRGAVLFTCWRLFFMPASRSGFPLSRCIFPFSHNCWICIPCCAFSLVSAQSWRTRPPNYFLSRRRLFLRSGGSFANFRSGCRGNIHCFYRLIVAFGIFSAHMAQHLIKDYQQQMSRRIFKSVL